MENDSFKRLVFIICLVVFHSCSLNMASNDSLIQFAEREHNFGTLQYKIETEQIFEFINPGKTPLIITSVKTSCGCTAADWAKEPVKPGKSGQVMIKYDADSPGIFHKTIKVHYNGENSPVQLSIKGQVEYPENLDK